MSTLRELLERFTGYIPVGLLGRGSPSSSVYLRGDGRWEATPAAGGPATQIQESSGPTTLTIGAIADGEFAKRVGATLVGAAAGGGTGPTDAQVTLDFSTGKEVASVSLADATVLATTRVSATLSVVASADKTADEVLADPIWVAAAPVAGVGIVVYGKPLAGGQCIGKYLVDVLYQ